MSPIRDRLEKALKAVPRDEELIDYLQAQRNAESKGAILLLLIHNLFS